MLVPHKCKFAFDIIEYIGKALFIRNRSDLEIQEILFGKNISISLREIAYLGKKFIIYLALCHQASNNALKQHIQSKGGYILHVDGTCEGNSPHLISSMDGISKIVLDNIKAPSENSKQLIPFFKKIKENYGSPVAIVHDMSAAIINSVNLVFPDSKDFICHYHFLRDLGKDLFGFEYNNIRRYLKTFKLRTILRAAVRELKKFIEQEPELQDNLQNYLSSEKCDPLSMKLLPIVSMYISIIWVLEANSFSKGYGFPFDRTHFEFYVRLQKAYPVIKKLSQLMSAEAPKLSLKKISYALNDSALKRSVTLMKEKISIFDDLRKAMSIASLEGSNGLNDEGEGDIKSIETQVKAFRQSEKINTLASRNISYKKMTKQIDKYWDKLFADPIQIKVNNTYVTIQPQRTNNIMETFFRDYKKGNRKKAGTISLSKTITAMLSDTPLVKNLKIPKYTEIILNGKESLAKRFAEIDIQLVRENLKEENEMARKYTKGIAKIFNIKNLPQKLNIIESDNVLAA